MAVMKSDDALITLNTKIETALKQYVNGPQISFDIVDKDHLPDASTICVFLYDIQEDLELRHGKARQYDAVTGTFAARQVHMRCCYLLTYWEARDDKAIAADAQSVKVMNQTLNALLNMQFDDKFPAVLRVVAPSEHLSSLGNFWQSLGDRPRLCLNFNVTIPIQLGLNGDEDTGPMVREIELEEPTGMLSNGEALFRQRLLEKSIAQAVSDKSMDLNALRGQLSKLRLTKSAEAGSYTLEAVVDARFKALIEEAATACAKECNIKVTPKLVSPAAVRA